MTHAERTELFWAMVREDDDEKRTALRKRYVASLRDNPRQRP